VGGGVEGAEDGSSNGFSTCSSSIESIDDHVCVVAPLVSKHFDILQSMDVQGKLPLPLADLGKALSTVMLLLGSAPVGPTTVRRPTLIG
jgi:hypothetical protein